MIISGKRSTRTLPPKYYLEYAAVSYGEYNFFILYNCLNLILFFVKIILSTHVIQDSTTITTTHLRLRIKVRQHDALPVLSLLLRQAQIKRTLRSLLLLLSSRTRRRKDRVVAPQEQLPHAPAAIRPRQHKRLRHCTPAPPPQLHGQHNAISLLSLGGRGGLALQADEDALAPLAEAPFRLDEGLVARALAGDFLRQAGEPQDGGGEVAEDGQGRGLVLAKGGGGQEHGHVGVVDGDDGHGWRDDAGEEAGEGLGDGGG